MTDNRSLTDGAIAAFAAILESMPEHQKISAAKFARVFLEAGLISGEEGRRFVEGLFLLVEKPDRQRELSY